MAPPVAHTSSLRSAIFWSLGVHALCLVVLTGDLVSDHFRLRAQTAPESFSGKRINVWLRAPTPVGAAIAKEPDEAIAASKTLASAPVESESQQDQGTIKPSSTGDKTRTSTSRIEQSDDEVDGYRAPQLLTDVGIEVYGATQNGSIIVRVDVDVEGQASNLVRLYSSVPSTVARALEHRILAAKFRPAERDGIPLSGTVEVTVTVEPSRVMNVLDAS